MACNSASANTCITCEGEIKSKIIGQTKCIACIMKTKPSKPVNDNINKDESEFVNWFIYNWRKFQATANKMKS